MKEKFFQRKQYSQHKFRKEYGKKIMDDFNKSFEECSEEIRQEFTKVGLSPSEIENQIADMRRELQIKVIKEFRRNVVEIARSKHKNKKKEGALSAEMKSPR